MALFQPFRALGYVTDDVPFAVQRRGKETYVTVSVGKAWQVYNTANLRLVLVGPQLKDDIAALACKGDLTFAAVRGAIIESRRVHRSGEYRGHRGDILQLLVLGDNLLSLGRDGQLLVWRIGEYEAPQAAIQLPPGFVPTCMAHPDTYLNKVLVGSDDGRMQLWNFATGQRLHEFAGLGAAVRCIAPSPALDVVGVGLADGRAVLYNVRYDEAVMEFANATGVGTNADRFLSGSAAQAASLAAGGACTCLSFRSGGGVPLMAAGGGAGVVTVWDLEQRKLHALVRDAHDAPLTRLHFFAGEPVLMSAGADNALKQWVFDGADGAPRLLRFRSGHAAPPTSVRHYGDGARLLSAGQDRALRLFSTIQDAQSRELSQRHTARRAKRLRVAEVELKLGRLVGLDACDVRERDWSNVITAHEGDASAYVWRLQRFALGEHVLRPPPKELLAGAPPPAPVSAVCLSRCGNFGFVGSAAGRVDRYNMQSGLHRGAYSRGGPGGAAAAHDGAVLGMAADACNRYLVTAGLDGVVRSWDFAKRTLRAQADAGSPVARIAHHASTGLLAAACDDLVIRMFDVEAMRVVRRFRGHTDRITDLQLSEDCRWLLSSSMDNTLRVWDVPGARVLQVLRLGSPVTSLSLSPSQDLLATTHVERDGVYLWANQLIFGSGADVVPSETPVDARLPTVGTGRGRGRLGGGGGPGGGDAKAAAAAATRAMLRHSARAGGAAAAAEQPEDLSDGFSYGDLSASDLEVASSGGEDSDSDGGGASDSSESAGGGRAAAAAAAAAELDPAAGAPYSARDRAGAPVPLVPHLATLSMLPRTQWQNLVHLDTIKARNRPVEPPTKPAAAPFFLPTLVGANAGRTPVFDPAAAPDQADDQEADPELVARAAAAWGSGSDEEEAGGGGGGGAGASRVLHGGGAPAQSRVAQLLLSCSQAGDWTSLVAHLRGLSPSQVDRELRSMELLEGDPPAAERQLELLLRFLEAEAASGANFEFVQALLAAALRVHGEAVAERPALRAAAARVEARVGAAWRRLDGLLQHVRCMVGLLGNLQG